MVLSAAMSWEMRPLISSAAIIDHLSLNSFYHEGLASDQNNNTFTNALETQKGGGKQPAPKTPNVEKIH